MEAPAVSLVGQSKPAISVLLPTLTFISFFPALKVRVLDSLSKPTSLPLMGLEGQPAKTEPASAKEAKIANTFFMMNVVLGCSG